MHVMVDFYSNLGDIVHEVEEEEEFIIIEAGEYTGYY